MAIIDSIYEARRRGASDDAILAEIERQNPQKAESIARAKNAGHQPKDIVSEIIKQNSAQPQVKQEVKKSAARKVGDFFTSSTQKFAQSIGDALATTTDDYQGAMTAQSSKDDQLVKMSKQIGEMRKQGKDTRQLEQTYKNLSGRDFSAQEIAPSVGKTGKQVAGEAVGTAVEALSFGSFGKKAATKVITPAMNAVRGAKSTIGAFVKGGTAVGAESGLMGGAGAAATAMQENKSTKEIAKDTTQGAAVSGLLGVALGGLSAKNKFKAPEKSAKLKEEAVEQYKKGLQASKEKFKDKTDKIIPKLLKEERWGTFKQLMKSADDGIELARDQYKQLGELQGIIEVDGLINTIDDEASKMLRPDGQPISSKRTSYEKLLQLKDDITAYQGKIFSAGDNGVSINTAKQQDLRELAQVYGSELYDTRKAMKTINDSKTLSQVKKVDGAIRSLLNTKNPEYEAINKVNNLNNELKDILIDTAKRKEGQKVMSLIRTIASSAGLAPGAIVGATGGDPVTATMTAIVTSGSLLATTEMLNSTWYNTLRAVQKDKLADKLVKESAEDIPKVVQYLSRQGGKFINEYIGE
jgi:hypothetical protein